MLITEKEIQSAPTNKRDALRRIVALEKGLEETITMLEVVKRQGKAERFNDMDRVAGNIQGEIIMLAQLQIDLRGDGREEMQEVWLQEMLQRLAPIIESLLKEAQRQREFFDALMNEEIITIKSEQELRRAFESIEERKRRYDAIARGFQARNEQGNIELQKDARAFKKGVEEEIEKIKDGVLIEKRMQAQQVRALVGLVTEENRMQQLFEQAKQTIDQITTVVRNIGPEGRAKYAQFITIAMTLFPAIVGRLESLAQYEAHERSALQRLTTILKMEQQEASERQKRIEAGKRVISNLSDVKETRELHMVKEVSRIQLILRDEIQRVLQQNENVALLLQEMKEDLQRVGYPALQALEETLAAFKKDIPSKEQAAWKARAQRIPGVRRFFEKKAAA